MGVSGKGNGIRLALSRESATRKRTNRRLSVASGTPAVMRDERFVVYAVDTGEVAEVTPDESGEEQSWTALSRWLNDCRWLSAEAGALPSALTHSAG